MGKDVATESEKSQESINNTRKEGITDNTESFKKDGANGTTRSRGVGHNVSAHNDDSVRNETESSNTCQESSQNVRSKNRKSRRGGRGRNGIYNKSSVTFTKGSNAGTPRPLQLPHAKVTIRRIGDVEKYGSKEQMESFIRTLCTSKNTQKDNSNIGQVTLVIDEFSLMKCCYGCKTEKGKDCDGKESSEEIETLEKQLSKVEESKRKLVCADLISRTESKCEGNIDGMDSEGGSHGFGVINDGKEEKCEIVAMVKPHANDLTSSNSSFSCSDETSLQSIPSKTQAKHTVTVRVLYIVPPRRSRRRGILTGVVYLVLYPVDRNLEKDSDTENLKNPIGQERSKTVASARLTLQNAQEFLSSQAAAFSSTLGSCSVELSISQKTWKDHSNPNALYGGGNVFASSYHHKSRSDRYENTIHGNEDYMSFLDGMAKAEEERANRPKPQPGGGEYDVKKTVSSEETCNDGKNEVIVSALVKYLQDMKKSKQTSKQVSNQPSVRGGASSSSLSNGKKGKKITPGSVKILEKSKGGKFGGSSCSKQNSGDSKQPQSSSATGRKKERKKSKAEKKKKAAPINTDTKGYSVAPSSIMKKNSMENDDGQKKLNNDSSKRSTIENSKGKKKNSRMTSTTIAGGSVQQTNKS